MAENGQQQRLRLAVLISGAGTTLRNLIEKQAAGKLDAELQVVVSSRQDAGGLEIARAAGIATEVVAYREAGSIEDFSESIFEICRRNSAQLVVMGGFLKRVLIPADYENRVINIHPSLIPAHAGHGFYGLRVHESVIQAGDKVSGCTVHVVDDEYDHGPVIAQEEVPVKPGDTPQSLAKRVFAAECTLLPEVINMLAQLPAEGADGSAESEEPAGDEAAD